MHVAMVAMDGYKMSKSRGNLVFVDHLRRRYDPRAIRLGLLVNHYRHEWEWDEGLIDRATVRLGKWAAAGLDSRQERITPAHGKDPHMYGTDRAGQGESAAVLAQVRAHLDDDLDTPSAIAVIDQAAERGVHVGAAAALLGVTA
jgi:L-cysteine:1D-myo-inositol 2-amino-2-deoxy-alpha-D-glucopyranoside ligase